MELSIVERAMYDSYLISPDHSENSVYLRQLCCFPKLSSKIKDFLVDCKTLDEIGIKMIDYHENMIVRLNDENIILQNDLDSFETDSGHNKKKKNSLKKKIEKIKNEIKMVEHSIIYFKDILPKIKEQKYEDCPICLSEINPNNIMITICGHVFCQQCLYTNLTYNKECPVCRTTLNEKDIFKAKIITDTNNQSFNDMINNYSTKIAHLIQYLKNNIMNTDEKCIIFSQFDNLLVKVGKILKENDINNIFCKGNIQRKNKSISEFKSNRCQIIMLSTKNTASGLNLTDASNVLFLEPISGDKDYVEDTHRQAINRVYRIGQKNKIKVVHFMVKDTIEETIYNEYIKKKEECSV